MQFTADEYRLVIALAPYPEPILWTALARAVSMPGARARAARDRLLSARVLVRARARVPDARDRARERILYALAHAHDLPPSLRPVVAWARGSRTEPPPIPPPLVHASPSPRRARDPRAPIEDVLLELVLRNPGVAWRHLVHASGRRARDLRRAAAELEAQGVLRADAGYTIRSNGAPYVRRVLVPVEDHPRVVWARERYRIPYAPAEQTDPRTAITDWRAQLRRTLARFPERSHDLYDGALELDPAAPREELVRHLPRY